MATNTKTDETLADQIAMALGGGLVLLSVVVMGLIEIVTGTPYVPTDEAGEALAGATIDPYTRGLVLTVGFVVLMVYAIYVFATKQHLDA